MNVGFVTWDGPDQNYMESLFLPIFARIAAVTPTTNFATLQFTWDTDTQSIARASLQHGFGYTAVNVLRKPLQPATALMIKLGARRIVEFAVHERLDVLVPRSTICAAMVLAAQKKLPGIRILFDADGFVADERVDFGGWSPTGIPYRLFRDIEARMAHRANAIIVRTHQAKDILTSRAGAGFDAQKVVVVPNGKDTKLFHPLDGKRRAQIRKEMEVPGHVPWIVYAGSIGPQYYPERMLRFFELLADIYPAARLQILTGQPEQVHALVARSPVAAQVNARRVPPSDVPAYLAAADLGLAFRKPTFSQRGVAPIKIAEYLLCGLPVAATKGVGDTADQLDDEVAVLLDDLSDDELGRALSWFANVLTYRAELRRACRKRGEEHFDLDVTAELYAATLSQALLGN